MPVNAATVAVNLRRIMARDDLTFEQVVTATELDERTLKDIGFNRNDAYAESGRSFWDLPVDRLRA